MKIKTSKTLIALVVSALIAPAFIATANASRKLSSDSMTHLAAPSPGQYLVTGTQEGHPALIEYVEIPKTDADRVNLMIMLTNYFGINDLRGFNGMGHDKGHDVRTTLDGSRIKVTSTLSKIDFAHDKDYAKHTVALMQISADHKEVTSTFIYRDPKLSLDEMATSIIKTARKNNLPGAVTLNAFIVNHDDEVPVIFLSHAKVDVNGALSNSVHTESGKDLSLNQINRDMPLIRDIARSQGGTPKINVSSAKDGVITVNADIKKDSNPLHYGVVASSYGSRYSGQDVASAFIQGAGNGFLYSGTLSEGLPFLTPADSKGGYYTGMSFNVKHPDTYGTITFGASYSAYKQGGETQFLDITGRNMLVDLGYERPFSVMSSLATPYVKLMYGNQREHIGIADISGSQSFTAVKAGVRESGSWSTFSSAYPLKTSFDAAIVQGISASETGMGLGRNLDRHFRVATLDATVSQDISSPVGTFTVATAFGGQKARGLNPSQIDFYLGGANRGSGYRTGIAATPSGAYGSARVYAPNYTFTVYDSPVGIRPYFGYNSAVGQPVIGHSLRASSVEVGTQVQISRNFSGEIGYALITDHQGAHADNGLVNFNVVASF